MGNPTKIEINGATYVLQGSSDLSNLTIVRSRDAGVHIGERDSSGADDGVPWIKLKNARRIWRWRGANTLNEVATKGIEGSSNGYTRVSEPISEIMILNQCEELPVTEAAAKSICEAGWAK